LSSFLIFNPPHKTWRNESAGDCKIKNRSVLKNLTVKEFAAFCHCLSPPFPSCFPWGGQTLVLVPFLNLRRQLTECLSADPSRYLYCRIVFFGGQGERRHHKEHIYIEYHRVCPLVGNETPPPLLSAVEGVGEPQSRRLEKKLSTLSTLRAKLLLNILAGNFQMCSFMDCILYCRLSLPKFLVLFVYSLKKGSPERSSSRCAEGRRH
jgi:hypothetical protein